MAETLQNLQPNPAFQSLFHALDPISLILSQNSNSENPIPLRLTTESYILERGPRYKAYADLRESKLRMKNLKRQEHEEEEEPRVRFTPPPKKQVKFQGNFESSKQQRRGGSVLAQSVPDFSAALRKENRKPATALGSVLETTPPLAKNWSKVNGILSNSRGSKSANAGEKRGCGGGGLVSRKSYANVEELKGISSAAANAIMNGENRGGRSGNGRWVGKTVLGNRQF